MGEGREGMGRLVTTNGGASVWQRSSREPSERDDRPRPETLALLTREELESRYLKLWKCNCEDGDRYEALLWKYRALKAEHYRPPPRGIKPRLVWVKPRLPRYRLREDEATREPAGPTSAKPKRNLPRYRPRNDPGNRSG